MLLISRRQALVHIGKVTGVTIISGISGCAVNPVTGKREFMLMSENQEISMGGEAHGQIVTEYGSYNDNSMQEWFSGKGKEMAQVTHRKNLPWHFTVLDSPVINAFAVPGGYVYVTRGILGYFNNEAQFAGVLGHELGHVNARHTAARYSKAKLANVGLAIGSIFSEEFNRYSQLVSMGTTLLFLKFSRNDERQADQLGVEYSSAVGYDAVQMSLFFKTLERLSPKGGSLPAWQSTHPDPGDRVNDTRKQSLAYQKSHTDMTFRSSRDEYLDRINGIIYGDNPRQGYAKDSMFYHPEMKLQFPVPEGWQVSNQPSEVRMSPEKQDAMLIFTLAKGADPGDAAVNFAQKNNVKVSNTAAMQINGMNAVKTLGEMAGQDQVIGIASYFIGMNENIYVFHGLSAPGQLFAYDRQFSATAHGFDALTDESLMDVAPKKIEVRKVEKKSTLQEIFNAFGVPEEELENLSIINGMELSDEVEPGMRIKIIA